MPLFGRLGCNAGLCHGSLKGKNGFRLSLFGSDPGQDHEWLVKELGGRRINRQVPEASLLLQKMSGRVPHEGGKRAEVGGPEYQVLRDWIEQGAGLDDLARSRIKQLRVSPAEKVVKAGATPPAYPGHLCRWCHGRRDQPVLL